MNLTFHHESSHNKIWSYETVCASYNKADYNNNNNNNRFILRGFAYKLNWLKPERIHSRDYPVPNNKYPWLTL